MNLWKLSSRIAFSAVTAVCVNYAHSQSQETKIWRSSAILGSCSLKAVRGDGQVWDFQPAGFSRTRFKAFWPKQAGELWLTKMPIPRPGEPLVGVDPADPDETLLIKFADFDGNIEPVSLIYDNVKLRKATRGTIQPKICSLKRN